MITLMLENDDGTHLRIARLGRHGQITVENVTDGDFTDQTTWDLDGWAGYEARLRDDGYTAGDPLPYLNAVLFKGSRTVLIGGRDLVTIPGPGLADEPAIYLADDALLTAGFRRMGDWWASTDNSLSTVVSYRRDAATVPAHVAPMVAGALEAAAVYVGAAIASDRGEVDATISLTDRFQLSEYTLAAGYRMAACRASQRLYTGRTLTALRMLCSALMHVEGGRLADAVGLAANIAELLRPAPVTS